VHPALPPPHIGRTVSLLPAFLLSHSRGRAKSVEDSVAKVESRQREHCERTGKRLSQFQLAEWLRPTIGLPGPKGQARPSGSRRCAVLPRPAAGAPDCPFSFVATPSMRASERVS